jgi:hypothetical protein
LRYGHQYHRTPDAIREGFQEILLRAEPVVAGEREPGR